MGLISGITTYVPKLFNYGKRAVKVAPYVIFDKGGDVFVNAVKNAPVKDALKIGGKALESSMKGIKGGFWKNMWNQFKSIPSVISGSTKAGARAARIAGKSSILGGMKGFFKGIGKRMPLIGNLMLIGFELPNIFKATKEEGIGQGVKEVAKAGTRLCGGAIGGAIGSAICPGIGSLIGWVAGEWLTSKIVGKSYTEKKAEEEQKAAEQMTTVQKPQVPFQGNNNQYAPNNGMTNPFNNYNYNYNDYMSPYTNDIMMQQMNFSTLA